MNKLIKDKLDNRTWPILWRAPHGIKSYMIDSYGYECSNGFDGGFDEYIKQLDTNELPIECLLLDTRTYNALKHAGIDFIKEIKDQAFSLAAQPQLGKNGLKQIQENMDKLERGEDLLE
jgi:hypothetical protein